MSWLPKKAVVVPVDFSTASRDALKTALQFVAQPQNLHVIHVALPPVAFTDLGGWAAANTVSQLQAASEELSRFLGEGGATEVTQVVREGDPGLLIADYADECHADLIVIPSHGYHGVKRLLLGSVAERVLRHAKCPILLLRRQD